MRIKKGTVTSAKMDKTVTVLVTRSVMHPIYRKRFPVSKKFLADTAGMDVKEGDLVVIGETAPMSKRKRFKVLEIIGKKETIDVSLDQELESVTKDSDSTDQTE
ncbi:30S ribosomal protein S17 [Candidatus Peribacteria bacterium]|jgi:small subunit ribosomal protein S17|nr:30S ribosomal protein S17 [Candidatus Peribacteria bacterium]MBT4021380.1 30S ribosomal protein S17 [Candidatus Peribacteria bacterium]MBT4240552.1 30S ribosomal protein S17 [Candidatus Peribacteria bacterium]MBT4474396.1 30S ribosomal protein S17 [Candidatus Peribacteria bacterium]